MHFRGYFRYLYYCPRKRKGAKVSRVKRDLQASIFFTVVMFLTAAVAYVGTDITSVSLIPFVFFIMGLFMIIINLWKRRKTKAEYL